MSQDPTFELIQSLSPNEKRFFRLQSGEEKNYLHVFDALDAMKEYDAEALRKKLRKKNLNISYEKNYLYNQILKSLRIYHTEANVKSKARAALDYVDVLLQKGLFDQALKVVKKNESIFELYENFSNIVALHDYEEAILHRIGSLSTQSVSDAFYKKRTDVLERYQNMVEYRILERQMINLNHLSQFSIQKDKLQKIKKHRLVLENRALSFDAKFRFFQVSAMIAIYEHDYKKEAFYFKEIIALINRHPEIKEAYYKVYYFSALHNFANACLSAGDYDEMAKTVDELKELDAAMNYKDANLHSFRLMDEAGLHTETGDLQKFAKLIPEMEAALKKFPFLPGYNKSLLIYATAMAYFICEDYRGCIKTLQNLIVEMMNSEYKDRQAFSRIMLLVSYYEMGRFDMIDYVLNSTQRFLKRNDRYFKTEKTLLDFFRNAVRDHNISKSDFEKLKQALVLIFKDKDEASLLFLFDFIAWIDSKLLNVPFVKVVAAKAAAANTSIYKE